MTEKCPNQTEQFGFISFDTAAQALPQRSFKQKGSLAIIALTLNTVLARISPQISPLNLNGLSRKTEAGVEV